MADRLRVLHRAAATLVAAFAILHIGNQLAALPGVELHQSVMTLLRRLYRNPVIEPVLLASVAVQVSSGAALIVSGRRNQRGILPDVQAGAGLVLALFLVVHLAAVFYGRMRLHLDTNFYFAAAGFHVRPFQWFFWPYYFLGVLALFVHIGCALEKGRHRDTPGPGPVFLIACTAAGVVVAALITLGLAGVFHDLPVPPAYLETFAP